MKPLSYTLVPSLPAADLKELSALADALHGVSPELQVDIVDGEFVPPRSWPFAGGLTDDVAIKNELLHLKAIATFFSVEMDCMIVFPERFLDVFAELGVTRVVVHEGSTMKFNEIVEHKHKHGYKLGLGFTNDIDLDLVKLHMHDLDYVQVMGIREVGAQGQPFDGRTLETVKTLREAYPQLEIAVDGSVNKETIPKLIHAGVNRLAPGSAIAKTEDPKTAYEELIALMFAEVARIKSS